MNEVDKFVVKIWSANSELAFIYDESSDFHFLQESIRVSSATGDKVTYIALDSVVSIILYKNVSIKEVW